MGWILLYIAIALEVVGTLCLRLSEGYEKLWYAVAAFTLYAISLGLLGLVLKTIPMGVSYAIWAGLGTVITAAIAVAWFGEPFSILKGLFLTMVVVGCVGLNLLTEPLE